MSDPSAATTMPSLSLRLFVDGDTIGARRALVELHALRAVAVVLTGGART
jgi:hypothetical protein